MLSPNKYRIPRLFSYCISFDGGSAPNPFWGVCTLNICKPAIRYTAKIGDWIVATGSKHLGFENKVVYAMEITQKMRMEEYAEYCRKELPNKIPNWRGKNYKERVGDSIYDFSNNPPKILKSVHTEANRRRDLSGIYTLLSEHFYYFGDRPESLPDHLHPIVRQGQGYRSNLNQPFFNDFVNWIMTQSKARNRIYSEPNERHLFTIQGDSPNNEQV